jgi:hypothetical protein
MINERARFRLHHPVSAFSALEEKTAGEPDAGLARRVIAAFAIEGGDASAGPVWDDLLDNNQAALLRWLREGDDLAVARDMAALGRSEAAQGFFGGANQHRKCQADPDFAKLLAVWTYDKLLSLAEAVGVVRHELAENGAWAVSNRMTPTELIDAIGAKLGVDLSPPEHVGGYLGIGASGQVVQMRMIEAIYAAWRLKSLSDRYELKTICEIGAGAGLTAYYAQLLGIDDYIIIDLPSMNAVQGYMLGGSRVGEAVILHGEQDKSGSRIRILPTTAFAKLREGEVGILYNQDSFPEIEVSAARCYIEGARRLRIQLLWSINQEAHLATREGNMLSVPELVASVGGYRLFSRHRHWLRQGYLDELYELSGD